MIIYWFNRKQSRSDAPADVVSVAIARQHANSAKNVISERNLQYGSLKNPTIPEVSTKNQAPAVNEELFYDTNGNILELRPQIFRQQSESETEESFESDRKKKPSYLSELNFSQIGYKPVEAKRPRYVVVKNSEPVKHECNQKKHKKFKGSCDCAKDLVVQETSISEQAVSDEYEDQRQGQRYIST